MILSPLPLHSAHSTQQSGLPEHIYYGYDHKSKESQEDLTNEDHQNNSQSSGNNNKNEPKVFF